MPYEVVAKFERTIAEFAGAKYGVAVSSCTNALFLCCVYEFRYASNVVVTLPRFTYPGVPCSVIHAGGKVRFKNLDWEGCYALQPYRIIDSALRFHKNMYVPNTLYCISFHYRKLLPIGRGGMILCDSKDARDWFIKARFDGRVFDKGKSAGVEMLGWNMYMTPEQAARGLSLFDAMKNKYMPDLNVYEQNYPDLSEVEAYAKTD